MVVAAILYLLLLSVVSFNVMHALEWPLLFSLLPILLVTGIVGGIYAWQRSKRVLLQTLGIVGMFGLTVVALTFAIPAYEIIFEGESSAWTTRLTPMFVAAIALYICGLWIAATSINQSDALEWLAKFLGGPNIYITMISALILCSGTMLALEWLGTAYENTTGITDRFLDRGIIPPITLFMFFWGVLLLLSKWWNAMFLRWSINQWGRGTPVKVSSNIDRVRNVVKDASRLEDQLLFLWRRHNESYLLPRYINYATPVLGFIGTVLGISLAADGIRRIIASDSGLSGISNELGDAIAPLGIAFDTTLIALSLSVGLALLLALVQRGEERTLTILERYLRDNIRVY